MHYELYIDVFFLVNFMMDYLLLLTLRKALKCSATHGNVCIGAIAGSLLTCVFIVLPIPYAFVKFILFHVVVNTFMIRIGLRIKEKRAFIKAFIMLYVSGFLLGGVFEYLHQYVRVSSLFFALAIASYYLVQGIWKFIIYMQRMNQYNCEVRLYVHDKEYTVHAIIDTGNGLVDGLTGKPVHIISKKTAQALLTEQEIYSMRYISYHSIGKKEGVMPIVKIDKMCVERDEECWIAEPVIGICEEEISTSGEYEMILNPEIF